jgi:hypothetical protein
MSGGWTWIYLWPVARRLMCVSKKERYEKTVLSPYLQSGMKAQTGLVPAWESANFISNIPRSRSSFATSLPS